MIDKARKTKRGLKFTISNFNFPLYMNKRDYTASFSDREDLPVLDDKLTISGTHLEILEFTAFRTLAESMLLRPVALSFKFYIFSNTSSVVGYT